MKKLNGKVVVYTTDKFTSIDNVSITDGKNVVKSDSNGRFELDGHEKAEFVYITVPSGYEIVNDRYQKISDLQEEYVFIIKKSVKQSKNHKFLHITDTEINSNKIGDWINFAKELVEDKQIDFIIHTGDLCRKDGIMRHAVDMNLHTMNCPVYYTIGNHDYCDDYYGEYIYERVLGPVWYSFEYGDVHYIVTPILYGDYFARYKLSEMLAWMKNDIDNTDSEKKIIVFNHTYPSSSDYDYTLDNGEKFDLKEHNLIAWIFGHYHYNFVHKRNGVYDICTARPDCGGIDQSPQSMRIVNVDDECGLTTELHHWVQSNFSANYYKKDGEVVCDIHAFQRKCEIKSIEAHMNIGDMESRRISCIKKKDTLYNFATNDIAIEDIDSIVIMVTLDNGKKVYSVAKRSNDVEYRVDLSGNSLFSAPIITEDTTYIATCDDNIDNVAKVYSVETQTGKINWEFKTDYSVKNSMVLFGENLYLQDSYGNVYSLNAKDGRMNYKQYIETEDRFTSEGLAVDEENVYFASCSHIVALNRVNGDRKWETIIGGGCSNVVRILQHNRTLICGSNWNKSVCLSKDTGKILWTIQNANLSYRVATPIIKDDVLYMPCHDTISKYDCQTGELISEHVFSKNTGFNTSGQPLIVDNTMYISSTNRSLIAIDLLTFEEKWNYKISNSILFTTPYSNGESRCIENDLCVYNDVIYFGGSDGCAYGIDRFKGKGKFKYNNAVPILSSAKVSDGSIIFCDYCGTITKIRL